MTEFENATTDNLPNKPRAFMPSLVSRRGLIVMAGLVIASGLAFNWDWLVAVGMAPILIATLPCLVMCGLGLCMNRMSGGSCDKSSPTQKGDD